MSDESRQLGEESPVLIGDFYIGAYGPTIILIMESPATGAWLQQLFRKLARGDPATLTSEPGVQIANLQGIEMVCRTDGPRVTLQYHGDETVKSFVWSATTAGWLYLADLIQSLCDGGVGHHYLTEDKDDVALIELSSGEQDVLNVARSQPDA